MQPPNESLVGHHAIGLLISNNPFLKLRRQFVNLCFFKLIILMSAAIKFFIFLPYPQCLAVTKQILYML